MDRAERLLHNVEKQKCNFLWLTMGAQGIGCSICAAAGAANLWARGLINQPNSLQKVQMLRHARSSDHKMSIKNTSRLTPPLQAFEKTLEATLRREGIGKRGIDSVGQAEKVTKIRKCLAAARQIKYKEKLAGATCITRIADVSRSLLLIRFVCCGPSLELARGTLGVRYLEEGNAMALAAETEKLIRSWCDGNEDLLENIRRHLRR